MWFFYAIPPSEKDLEELTWVHWVRVGISHPKVYQNQTQAK